MNTIIPYIDNIPQFVLDNYNNSLNVDGIISRARFERLASKQVLDWMMENNVTYKILFAYIGKGHTKIFPTFCKVCGKELSLNAFKNDARYCNAKCSQKDPEVIALRVKNIQEKYGEDITNVSQRLQAPNMKYLNMDCLVDASKMTIELSKYQYTWNRPKFAMIQRNKLTYDIDTTINDIYWLCDAGTIALNKPS